MLLCLQRPRRRLTHFSPILHTITKTLRFRQVCLPAHQGKAPQARNTRPFRSGARSEHPGPLVQVDCLTWLCAIEKEELSQGEPHYHQDAKGRPS